MKSGDKEAKRSLSAAELRQELLQTQDQLERLRWKHALSPVDSPAEIRTLRRHVARIKTWIREKDGEASHGA